MRNTILSGPRFPATATAAMPKRLYRSSKRCDPADESRRTDQMALSCFGWSSSASYWEITRSFQLYVVVLVGSSEGLSTVLEQYVHLLSILSSEPYLIHPISSSDHAYAATRLPRLLGIALSGATEGCGLLNNSVGCGLCQCSCGSTKV
jgi:hypothetical protein